MRTITAQAAVILTATTFCPLAHARDVAAGTKRVSVSSASAEGGDHSGTGPAYGHSISADGTSVVFLSVASNLVAGDTNGVRDVFVRDCASGTTTRVSIATGGQQANGASAQPTISGDGRFVAYASSATNLAVGDTNGLDDVFMHDRVTGVTRLISKAPTATVGNGTSELPRFSADGGSVCFWSAASDLVIGDTNGTGDVFVFDLALNLPRRVSVASSGGQSNGNSAFGSISADGRFVAFTSTATNLAGPDSNGNWDIFVHDRQLGTTERIGPAAPIQWNADATLPSISDTGRWIAFQSSATNIAGPDTNGVLDVFVYDRHTSTAERASESSGGVESDGASEDPAISGNGQYVCFESAGTNLVVQDTNGVKDVFLRHLPSGALDRVSLSDSGQQSNGLSADPSISAVGAAVGFVSHASNLVAADSNLSPDAFVRDLGPGPIGNNYCVGATNSAGLSGRIAAMGSPFVADNNFTLVTRDAPPNKPGIFFYGPNQIQAPFGSGFRCVGGSTQRIQPPISTDASGVACRPLDLNSGPALNDITNAAPVILNFQYWHRDSMGTTNLTDAVEVRFF